MPGYRLPNYLRVLRIYIGAAVGLVLLCACGGGPSSSFLFDQKGQKPAVYWQEIAPVCSGYPSKADCDDGDMVLFGGLLCAAGERRGCDLVRDAQDGDGRWWRSPRRNPGNLGEAHSFSRDMALGVLHYLLATRDRAAAVKWLHWIDTHRPCLITNPLTGACVKRGLHRFCTDDQFGSCTIVPGNWALMGRVWEAIGLEPTWRMRAARKIDGSFTVLETKLAPIGYQLHLQAVEAYLKERLGATPSVRAQIGEILARRQPDNPFFAYLNAAPLESVGRQVKELCPVPGVRSGGSHHQWSWERDTASQAWQDSMGWDCLFLGRVLAMDIELGGT